MSKTTYEFLENDAGMIKTKITQEVDVDLSNTLKNIRQTRAEYQRALTNLVDMAKAMEAYVEQHKVQNEFLKQVWEFLGEDYVLPELEVMYDVKSMEKDLENFISNEKLRRKENLEANVGEGKWE